MNKTLLLIFPFLFPLFISAQNAEIFYAKEGRAAVLYARNSEYYPITVRLTLDLTNMVFSASNTPYLVVPARVEKYKLGEITVAKSGEVSRFQFQYDLAMGDLTLTKYDKNYVYDLPFLKGKSCKLFQGYNGKFSHQNENSLDFSMPEGSEVLAARDGVVVEIVQNNNQSCPTEECKIYNNYITIIHNDGTFARYGHLKFNGAKVNIGDKVKKGDLIALSGNTGWTSGPHLHFVCFTGAFGKSTTLVTKFRSENGQKITILKEGLLYSRNY